MDSSRMFSFIDMKRVIGKLPEKIKCIETDSRRVSAGCVFICIKGFTVDGHAYIQKAISAGASVVVHESEIKEFEPDVCYVQVADTTRALAILANVFYDFPSKKMNITGITGTNGKTTIASIINSALKKTGVKTGLMGTICIENNGIIVASKNTTNDALTIQRTLREMLDNGVKEVTMEVSSQGLVLGRLWGVEFTNAIFSNLTQDHLDFHITMDKYAEAKGLLFSQLGQDIEKRKLVILNADDMKSEYYKKMTSARVVTYGIENKSADYRVSDIRYYENFCEFKLLTIDGKETVIVSPLAGKFNIYNVVAAIILLLEKGIRLKDIASIIRNIEKPSGRMEKLDTTDGRTIYVDYAHTPDGIKSVLDSIKPFAKGKIIFLIGTGGSRDVTKRPEMTRIASERADFVVITTDNPRYETFGSIMRDLEAGMTNDNYVCIGDREEAIFHAVKITRKNDILILSGKGHETYQIVGNKEIPFNDKEVALRAIKKHNLL